MEDDALNFCAARCQQTPSRTTARRIVVTQSRTTTRCIAVTPSRTTTRRIAAASICKKSLSPTTKSLLVVLHQLFMIIEREYFESLAIAAMVRL